MSHWIHPKNHNELKCRPSFCNDYSLISEILHILCSTNHVWKALNEWWSENTGLISSQQLLITGICTNTGSKMIGFASWAVDLSSLLQKLGNGDITTVLCSRRLRLYVQVQCATSCIKWVTDLRIPGNRGRKTSGKIWCECVKIDVSNCGLVAVDPLDRNAWKADVRHSLVVLIPLNGTWTAPILKTDMDDDGWVVVNIGTGNDYA